MIDSIRHIFDLFTNKPSTELETSRAKTDALEERAILNRKLLDNPKQITEFDLARLLDDSVTRKHQ
jgi:hypothetical protein